MLFHLPIFSDFFEEGRYLRDFGNGTSSTVIFTSKSSKGAPNSSKGTGIVGAFAQLLGKMRENKENEQKQPNDTSNGKTGSIQKSRELAEDPKPFKTKMSEVLPRFSGKSEEDAQEFLVSLLEAMSRELTRRQSPSQYKNLSYENEKSLEENVTFTFSSWNSKRTERRMVPLLFVKGKLHCDGRLHQPVLHGSEMQEMQAR